MRRGYRLLLFVALLTLAIFGLWTLFRKRPDGDAAIVKTPADSPASIRKGKANPNPGINPKPPGPESHSASPSDPKTPSEWLDAIVRLYREHDVDSQLNPGLQDSLLGWYPENEDGERLGKLSEGYTRAVLGDAEGAMKLLNDLRSEPDGLRKRLAVRYLETITAAFVDPRPMLDAKWLDPEKATALLSALDAREDPFVRRLAAALLYFSESDAGPMTDEQFAILNRMLEAEQDRYTLRHLMMSAEWKIMKDPRIKHAAFQLAQGGVETEADHQRVFRAVVMVSKNLTMSDSDVAAVWPTVLLKLASGPIAPGSVADDSLRVALRIPIGSDADPGKLENFRTALASVLPSILDSKTRNEAVEQLSKIDAEETLRYVIDSDDVFAKLSAEDYASALGKMRWLSLKPSPGREPPNLENIEKMLREEAIQGNKSATMRRWAYKRLFRLAEARAAKEPSYPKEERLNALKAAAAADADPEIRAWAASLPQ